MVRRESEKRYWRGMTAPWRKRCAFMATASMRLHSLAGYAPRSMRVIYTLLLERARRLKLYCMAANYRVLFSTSGEEGFIQYYINPYNILFKNNQVML